MTTTVESATPGADPAPGDPAGSTPDSATDSATDSTGALLAAVAAFAAEWAGALPAFGRANSPASPGRDATQMQGDGLMRVLQSGFTAKRQLDAFLTAGAGQLAYLSRPELGPDGLAKANGWGNAPALLAELGRITTAEGARLCRVGEATRERTTLQGAPLPARWAEVAAAVNAGDMGVDSALHIVTGLDQASPRAPQDAVDDAEKLLVRFGEENPADSVRKLSILCRDRLDTDGIEPREQELIQGRSLRYSTRANGMERLEVLLDPLSMSYVRAGIEGILGDTLRKVRFHPHPNTDPDAGHDAEHGADHDAGLRAEHGADHGDDCCAEHEILPTRDTDGRTIEQIRADALVDSFKHVLGCENTLPGLAHTTIIVRLDYDTLIHDLGHARIDGTEQPISAGTARRLAADADIIPLVLGGNSEVLDLGRRRRLFTPAQKLALIERDGGCAMTGCNRPPTHTEVHHLQWWKKHKGRTDLRNGVLLCSTDHHLIHRGGWDIQIIDNVPWFIPPPNIDTTRTPRRGGRIQPPTPT
jgi:Domain of unknown function (DUF222)